MLHPIDYRLSKNKFWLSTWNSYSLKNYRNLILNDKILNILGFIFKNCFKSSYSFASPWSNPRKNRKYFSNFVIGFDGRRAIRTGPNKVKKLPGFIIPEDYNIIRFSNFIVLKIYFLIDRNLETYWIKKQKNWRSPIKYLNMRYNKNKSKENALKFNKNLFIANVEKKNFKSSGFFMYLLNLLNNNSIRKSLYLNFSDTNLYFKKDKKHTLFRFYDNNFKLLNKIRNNYFLFYLSNKNNSFKNTNILNKELVLINPSLVSTYSNSFSTLTLKQKTKKKVFDKQLNFNYNLLNNFFVNYDLKTMNDYTSILYKFNKVSKTKVFNCENSSKLFSKLLYNKKSLKAFTTFSFFINKKISYPTSLISNNKSSKSFLFNSLDKKSFYNFNVNSIYNNFKIFPNNFSSYLKFWLNNTNSILKRLNEFDNSLEKSVIPKSFHFYKNLGYKKREHEFYLKSSKRRLPLLFFQGLLKKKDTNHKFNLKGLNNKTLFGILKKNNGIYKNNLLIRYNQYNNYKFVKHNSLNSYSKSSNFINRFILSNYYKNKVTNDFNNKNSIIHAKNTLSIYKNLDSNSFLKRLKNFEKFSIFSNLSQNHKVNFDKDLSKLLNSSFSKLSLSLSNNKWSNLYKILNFKGYNKNIKNIYSYDNSISNYNKFLNFIDSRKNLDCFDSSDINNFKKQISSIRYNNRSINNNSLKNISNSNNFKTKNVINFYNYKKKYNSLQNNVFLGKVSLTTNNFYNNLNYSFSFNNFFDTLVLNSKILEDKKSFKNSIGSSLLEYKPFLYIMKHKAKGYNLNNRNNNINYSSNLIRNFDTLNHEVVKSKNNSSLLINKKLNHLINSDIISSYKWSNNKDFNLNSFFNSYFKKTFSRGSQRQDAHSLDDISQIEIRLNSKRVNKIHKFLKFKPYSLRSVSRIQRFKSHNSILTTYLKKAVKKNNLFAFYELMENKKFIFKKNFNRKSFKIWFNNMSKAKGGLIFKNLNSSNFNYYKVVNYAMVPFFENLSWLKFFNKSIKRKENDPFKEFKRKKEKYLFNNLSLSNYNYQYNEIIKKIQFKYFKRKRWSTSFFNNSLYIKDIVIKPFKPLLFANSNYSFYVKKENYSNKFYNKFNLHSYKKIGFGFDNSKNNFKYKLINYNYYLNNKNTNMNVFLIPSKYRRVSYFTYFSFKSNKISKNFFFKKSTNLSLNKYIKSKLSDFFVGIKKIESINKNSKIKKEDLDLRIYGLSSKLSSPRIKFSEKKKRIDKLKPKTFLYWHHLKWFNLFAKSKFSSNVVRFDNFNVSFKVYENFKRLNFNYYGSYKKSKHLYEKNTTPFSSKNFNKLKSLTFFTTFLKSKNSFLSIKGSNIYNKKKLLLYWAHNLNFLSHQSKRLNYIPHIRYRALKSSMYMWKINSRKLNLLSRYYKARSKFYKNKLNFTSNSATKSSIISYLRLMESNFNRIRKSMQRDLPLISSKFYLRMQLKKLNSYMKVLLKRKKKRFFLRSERRKKNKSNQFYDNQFIKEKNSLPLKLFNFSKNRFLIEKKNLIDYVKKFIEHLFFIVFKSNNLRVFYIKKYQMNVMGTKAKLFKNLFNYRLATGFKIPFLVKVICKKLNFDKSLVGCKIGFFGRYSKKLRNRKIWRYVRHIKPSVISTPLDYYNILILQKWGITGIKLSMLRKKTFNFVFN